MAALALTAVAAAATLVGVADFLAPLVPAEAAAMLAGVAAVARVAMPTGACVVAPLVLA